MIYDALEVAKFIISKCKNDNKPITNLKLQKILYCVQRDFLLSGKKAFNEDIQAWTYGPIVPKVYNHYCTYGAMPINDVGDYSEKNIENDDGNRIYDVAKKYRGYSDWNLVKKLHKKDGAWDKTYKNGIGKYNVIKDDYIKGCLVDG